MSPERSRRIQVEKVLAAMRVSGLDSTGVAHADIEDYLAGRRTLEQIVVDATGRHTPHPPPQPVVPVAPPRPPASAVQDAGDMDNGRRSPWADVVGPCYTVDSLNSLLGLPKADILGAATDLQILLLHTADGYELFPSFQVRDAQVFPHLRSVLEVLRGGVDDPWTWAQWLNSQGSDGVTPMEQLWAGGVANVLREARQDAWAWRA